MPCLAKIPRVQQEERLLFFPDNDPASEKPWSPFTRIPATPATSFSPLCKSSPSLAVWGLKHDSPWLHELQFSADLE